jgi:predicted nucleic acid-binding protein
MDKLVLGTSAFVKLYLPEKGSVWLRNFIAGKEIILSQLVMIEFINTITRLQREGILSNTNAYNLYNSALRDVIRYSIVPVGIQAQLDKCYELGTTLPSNLRLRSLDSIHLATALIAQATTNSLNPLPFFTFVTADSQLIRTAQHFGLNTENPENHP